jgi:hypothetical protein
MPNWCSNRLVVADKDESGDALQAFFEAICNPDYRPDHGSITSEEGKAYMQARVDVWHEFDLTLPFPTPEILHNTRAPTPTPESIARLREMAESDDWPHMTLERVAEEEDLMVKGNEAFAVTGYPDWYDWNCANWGTKWSPTINTIVVGDDIPQGRSATIHYSTAWSPCQPLICKLSELWPTLVFIESYLEEGMGYYGTATYMDGDQKHDTRGETGDDMVLSSLFDQYHAACDEENGDAEVDAYDKIMDRHEALMDRGLEDARVVTGLTVGSEYLSGSG